MKYYIDTEFTEGTQKEKFPISLFRKTTPPTIDLISIGIVAEDGREYYAISKDFNLEEAWNRFDLVKNRSWEKGVNDTNPGNPEFLKVYWIRENVLKPIYYEWYNKDINYHEVNHFTYSNFKKLLSKYGKTNKEISEEIVIFTTKAVFEENKSGKFVWDKPEFYAYFADYDWVAFCWIFGKMMDLPNGFPKYCKDLKQILDESQEKLKTKHGNIDVVNIKEFDAYPKQENEHSAIHDARWNKKLHEFLNTI